MLPRKFATAARVERDAVLGKDASLVVRGCTRDGRQIRMYRGRLPGETVRGSLGHFLIVAVADSMDTSSNGFTSELIDAGSRDVRHPSYDSQAGRSGWSVATSLGRISLPSENAERPAFPQWDGEPIYPSAQAVPGTEPATPHGHGSAV